MTYQEAVNLKSFRHYCTCGAHSGMTERSRSRHPHMAWCPQLDEWEEWKSAMEGQPQLSPSIVIVCAPAIPKGLAVFRDKDGKEVGRIVGIEE